jgi:hypothetical protein
MFRVFWVRHGNETSPVEVEIVDKDNLDAVVSSFVARLPAMRKKHRANPPDGFTVMDVSQNEVWRWFGSPRPA